MKKLRRLLSVLTSVGTSGITDEGDVNRIRLVNGLCLITASSIVGVGTVVCYYYKWHPALLIPFIAEFIINGFVIFLNHYRQHRIAAGILYFLQCAMIIYLSVVLDHLLHLDIVIVLLFAMTFLLFKDKTLRRWGIAAALLDLVVMEAVYYKNPFQIPVPRNLSLDAAYIIQASVIFIMTFITILISTPYVKSNDTNEELKRANNLIKIFVAQLTHELRTPLDNIHYVTQLLKNEIRKDESLKKIQPLVDVGWSVSSSARHIVNNVLDMAEIEAGKMPMTISEAFKVEPFFEKMMEVHRIIARREGMKLELQIDAEMPEVIYGDPLSLNQILTNLLANALKYGSQRTVIYVEVKRLGQSWQLKVTNSGHGIPAGKIDSIFDPFVTGRTGHIQGSGLGLYIVRTKVSSMGGRVEVESVLNDRTTFTVTLPLREGKRRDLPDGAGSDVDTGDLQKVHVLVAEDDKLTAFLFSRFLKDMGCSFTMVKNGQELLEAAIRKCPDDCPDIIILDCHMPVLNGEETIRRLKQLPGLSHIPIIVTTGDLYSETMDRMLEAGANTYLKKPIDHLALQKTIILYLKKLPQN